MRQIHDCSTLDSFFSTLNSKQFIIQNLSSPLLSRLCGMLWPMRLPVLLTPAQSQSAHFSMCAPVQYKNINIALRSMDFVKWANWIFQLVLLCAATASVPCISTRNGYNNVSSIVVGYVIAHWITKKRNAFKKPNTTEKKKKEKKQQQQQYFFIVVYLQVTLQVGVLTFVCR